LGDTDGLPYNLTTDEPRDTDGLSSRPPAGQPRDSGGARDSGSAESDLPGVIAALARRIARSARVTGNQAAGAMTDGGPPVPDLDSQPVPDLDGEVGNLLFVAVALADAAGVDSEAALRRTARAFRDRIVALEERASGGDATGRRGL
jgi:hypothetical protein